MPKTRKKKQILGMALAFAVLWITAARGQNAETYKVRLTPVPIDATMMSTVTGSGSLSAVLTGRKLTISGTFKGMKSPAIDAHIHHAWKGIRGPAVLDVAVPNGTSGNINTAIELTPEQIQDLRGSSLYIQIDSQGAPDGNLWGWFLR